MCGERRKSELKIRSKCTNAFKAWIWKHYEKNWMVGKSFSFSYMLQLQCCVHCVGLDVHELADLTLFLPLRSPTPTHAKPHSLIFMLSRFLHEQNAAEKPPPFMPSWTAMYAINAFIVVWVLVVGFGFGGWASMTNFIKQIDTFGLFAKCYQCKPPPPAAAAANHHWVDSTQKHIYSKKQKPKEERIWIPCFPPYHCIIHGKIPMSPLHVMCAGFCFLFFLFFFFFFYYFPSTPSLKLVN